MSLIIQSTIETLQKSKSLLDKLIDEELCDASVSPYHSSIGTHIRHVFDFYECIFNINSENQIDLTARQRNTDVECKCVRAKDYLNLILEKLNTVNFVMDKTINVIDDLGLGKTIIPYTYGALFAQANSHAIHHYAIINYIFDRLGIEIIDSGFGYNPTTPKQTLLN